MAKKKLTIDISDQEILFELDNVEYKAILFKQQSMTVDCIKFEEGTKKRINLPFAHLPKKIKALLKS